jgi:hypothetical protein
MKDNAIAMEIDVSKYAKDFLELVQRTYKEKPDKEDLSELKRRLDENPALWRAVFDLVEVLQRNFIERLTMQKPARIAIEANILEIKQNMGYSYSSMLEKLLIENIIETWLRFQWTGYQLSAFMGKDNVRFLELEFWEKRLSLSQNRYLKACETLAKVRRLMSIRPLVQVNIARDNGQQVNIAGDFVKQEKATSDRTLKTE